MTTKDIIKILPLDNIFKLELLERFDTLSEEQQNRIGVILWDTYDALYALRLEENMQTAFLNAKQNKEKLDKDFYKRIHEQTEKQMQEENVNQFKSVDLESARSAMEMIVKEIKAAKIPVKPS